MKKISKSKAKIHYFSGLTQCGHGAQATLALKFLELKPFGHTQLKDEISILKNELGLKGDSVIENIRGRL